MKFMKEGITVKKIKYTLFIAVLCTMFMVSASACSDGELETAVEFAPEDCEILTQEEYTELLVDTAGLSYAEAEERAESEFAEMENISPRSQLATFSDTVTVGPYEVTFYCHIIIEDGSLHVFLGVGNAWSQATGIGEYTWNEGNVEVYYISNKKVQLIGSGVIEIEYVQTIEQNYGFSIEDFFSWGFGTATETTNYLRRTVSCNTFFEPWWV